MTNPYKEDRLANEKKDPTENSSLRFVRIPVVLLSMLVGFGVTYLSLRTDNTSMTPGDSRTPTNATSSAPEDKKNEESFDLAAFTQKGQRVFTTTCQACHQASGTGIPGVFPPLADSEWVLGPAEQMAAIILHGLQGEITVKGQKYNGVMPGFKDQLSHEDIAAVMTYVRQAWGNQATPATPELVNSIHEQTKSRTQSWAGESELKAIPK